MNEKPWKRERIIELPRSQRQTEPLSTYVQALYCGACGTSHTMNDAFCGMCGMSLQKAIFNDYTTRPFSLTVPSWQCR